MKFLKKLSSLFSRSPKPTAKDLIIHSPRPEFVRFFERSYIGAKMANGEKYDPKKLVMSHPHFPLGSIVKIEYTSKGGHVRSVMVQVTDRPAVSVTYLNQTPLDVSWAAFRTLENARFGTIAVRVTLLG